MNIKVGAKLSIFALALNLFTVISAPPANAVVVTATGTNPSICNQNVDIDTGVTAERLANGDCLIKFSSATTINWTRPATLTSAKVLIVGGGGGGGGGGSRNGSACSSEDGAARVGGGGGGGGGGQVKDNVAISNLSGTLTIVVGSGGTSGAAANCGAAGSDGGTGGTSSITTSEASQLAIAEGGGGGGGGPLTGGGGTGGSSKNSSGTVNAGGGVRSPSVACTSTSTTGCYAGGSGATGVAPGSTPTGNGTATSGAIGRDGVVVSAVVSARYGAGGGGGNRHPDSAPGDAARVGGAGGLGGGGAGRAAGNGGAATDFGGGGGGGRGNGAYDNSSNAGSGGAGFSGFVAISYTPDQTAPTFTSSTTFLAAENIATSSNAATIVVSESATVTISSGVDAALFNVVTSDSVTAFIRFKTSPNFEAPSDSGGNNVYDLVLTAIDPANNSSTQTIAITVTDVVDTSAFNSFALAGSVTTATYRTTIQITANVTVAAKITFRANNNRIPGCINVRTTGTSPNIVAVCNWKPSRRGPLTLTAAATPTGAGISSASATPIRVLVGNRTGTR